MSEETLKNKTARGLFWGGISSGTQQIIQVVFGVIMLRLLGPKEFGIVGMLSIFTMIATNIQDSGFTLALINKKNIQHKDYNAVFGFNIIISIILYLCLWGAAPVIANYFERPALIPISRVLFLSFLFGGIGIAQHAYIVKNIMVKEKAKIEISALFLSGLIGILLALTGFTYWAIVIQNVSYFTIATLIRWYYSPWKPTLHIDFSPLKAMFLFSIKIFLTAIFAKIIENIFSVLLGKYYKEEMVGYYTQGNKWSTMGGAFISGMIGNVAMPILTQISDDKERQRNALRKMFRFGAFVSFPLLLGLAFVGKEFLFIIGGGDKWIPVTPFLQLFCIWNSILFIYYLYTSLLLTHHKSDIYMTGTILIGSVQLIALMIMFKYGIFEMFVVYVIINILSLLFWHFHTNKLIDIKLLHVMKDIVPFGLMTLISIGIAWFATKQIDNTYIRLAAKIFITASIYIGIAWGSKSIIVRECFDFLLRKK
jgi:Membrane protein involved in the export of O-antigen and teichoic acid